MLGWTIRQLAEAANVHHNTVLRMENGRQLTSVLASNAIQRALEGAGVVFLKPQLGVAVDLVADVHHLGLV